jgi:hypothetical protein
MANSSGVIPNIPVVETGEEHIFMVPVSIQEGGGSGGTADTDETPFEIGSTSGTPIMGVIEPTDEPATGDLAVVALDSSRRLQVAGTFSSSPPVSDTSSSPAQTTVGTSAEQILAANGSRKGCAVQNTGTTIIYLGLGHDPSNTEYAVALPACGIANDGSSPCWDGTLSGVLWQGAIYAISSASGGTCAVTELT